MDETTKPIDRSEGHNGDRPRGMRGLLRRLIADESGAEILEYVLIAGLVIVATIAVIASFGTRVLARWTSVRNSSL